MADISVPSSTTATVIVPAARHRDWVTIQNASPSTSVFIGYDGTVPTVPGGANTGIELLPLTTFHFSRNEATPQSNINAIQAVQTSGAAVLLRVQVSQVNA